MNRLRARLGPLLVVVWLVALVLTRLIVQPPLAESSLLALGRDALDVLAVILLLLASAAIGQTVVRKLLVLSPAERCAVQSLVGLAILSLVVLSQGLVGWYPPHWFAWLLLLAVVGFLYRSTLAWLSDLRTALVTALGPIDEEWVNWLRWVVVLLVMVAAVLALLPPTKWDSLVYHLTGPRLYLGAGRIIPIQENHHLGFPQLLSMLYLWTMLLGRPQAAALIHWGMGVLTLLLTVGLAERFGRTSAGWLAIASLMVSESIWGEFYWPYNDLALMAYTLGAVSLILAWGGSENTGFRRLLVWAGAMTGCMMSVKYTAAPYALGIALLVAWQARRAGVIKIGKNVLEVAAAALLTFAPWLLKNLIIDGNPVSPFIWGTPAFDTLDAWYYARPGTGLSLRELVFFPIQAAVFSDEGGPMLASTGALVIGLLPLAMIGWKRRTEATRRLIVSVMIFAVPAYTWFLISASQSYFVARPRYLFAMFPLLALVGAFGLLDLSRSGSPRKIYQLIRAVIFVVAGAALVRSAVEAIRLNPLPVLVGQETVESYLTRELQAHYLAMQAVNSLPEEARVLFLWEPRTFYCEIRCIPDTLINRWWHDREIYGDPDAILRAWQDVGYTHLLVFKAGGRFLIEEEPYDPLTEADWEALMSLIDRLVPVWTELPSYGLYSLEAVRSSD